eukprot:347901-Karenia_brevis.AAC.1
MSKEQTKESQHDDASSTGGAIPLPKYECTLLMAKNCINVKRATLCLSVVVKRSQLPDGGILLASRRILPILSTGTP